VRFTRPGGGLEASDYIHTEPSFSTQESPQWIGAAERALRREIKEEVNLEVGDIHYLLNVAFIRPDGIAVLVLSFYCNYVGGEVKLDEDTTEHAWVSVEELVSYDFIVGIDDEIRAADKQIKT
jgi:8-oxo-dGTP pyrophosphatase MutT (NUDIX family)